MNNEASNPVSMDNVARYFDAPAAQSALTNAEMVTALTEVHSWARDLPIPTRGACSAMRKVRAVLDALAAAPVAAQAGQVAPAAVLAMVSPGELHDIRAGRGAVPVRGNQWRDDQTVPIYAAPAAGQVAVPEDVGAAITRAVVRCGHKITDRSVTLFANPKQDGNALSQLVDRIIAAAPSAPAVAQQAPVSQPLIGKLLDQFSELPVLWGLNEPGALVRHGDVFKMLVDAGKAERAQASTVGERQEGGNELQQVVDFLMGDSELEGVSFGERHPTKAGAFWWRLNLRAAMHKEAGARQE